VVRNSHATDALALGGATVAAGTGYQLLAGAVLTVDLPGGEQLFAIRGGANDITAHVLRLGA
jgi:hypothetical protein